MSDSAEASALLQLDASVDTLASDGDFDALARLLADDFRYIHSTGLTQSKSEWIEGLRRLVGQRRRVVSSLVADPHGDVVIVTGDLDVVWNDGRLALDRYARVYRRDGAGWRVFFQRTFPAHDRAKSGEA
ncbi:MAG TPA: nuclear transport factor 2 family protein [Dehalococcoidia bacterium]|nr:nuclear transport factor 2 family protein [Dehalococcoidia bacterium]